MHVELHNEGVVSEQKSKFTVPTENLSEFLRYRHNNTRLLLAYLTTFGCCKFKSLVIHQIIIH